MARLATLYQIADETADDPDEDEALTAAWCKAEQVAVAALVAAPARSPEELAVKCEWMARLIAEYASGCVGDVLHELVAAVARDARA
ncbi:MAG: hypothetical protein K0Q71_6338, partial [Thermomicrobiales bacterium]|nr:hypothetical protein [Thermomicrobiales bacterium]